ncbi:mucin-2-like [Ptychodera flava]|uniref:mucin-2-like n=1 Tax=Ptychodera flava TaxID=63121 RepID=UPI003969C1B2
MNQPHGQCADYEVRFLCDCATTAAPTTTTTCSPEDEGWTVYMDIDDVEAGPEGGDFERIDALREVYDFCANPTRPTRIECVEKYSYVSHDLIPGQNVTCNLDVGLECYNSKITVGQCADYAVRFYCTCPDCLANNDKNHLCIYTVPTTVRTFVSTTYFPPTFVSTTYFPPRCDVTGWTEYMDTDTPSIGDDGGDYELIADLRKKYQFCESPAEIDCVDTADETSFDEIPGQNVTCNVTRGLECNNKDQGSGKCVDYKVRFFCLCPTTKEASTAVAPKERTCEPYRQCSEDGYLYVGGTEIGNMIWNDDLYNDTHCDYVDLAWSVTEILDRIFRASSIKDIYILPLPTTTVIPTKPVVTSKEMTTTYVITTHTVTTAERTTPEVSTEKVTTPSVTTKGPTTREPSTFAATTKPQTTHVVTTEEVVTSTAKQTTVMSTKEETTPIPVTTEESTTQIVTITLEPETTPAITTKAPTTHVISTEKPTTAPTTPSVTTEKPTTSVISTEHPTTPFESTTLPVTTEQPTTHLVTTEAPTTVKVTTGKPTTQMATTTEPATTVTDVLAHTTSLPTAKPPTTQPPTTLVTTHKPTTLQVTTTSATTQVKAGTHTTLLPTGKISTKEPTTREATTQFVTTKEVTTPAATTKQATTPAVTSQKATTAYATTQEATTLLVTTKEATTSRTTKEQTTPTPATTEASTTEIVTVTLEKVEKVTTEGPTTKLVTTEGPTTPVVTTEGPTTRLVTTEGPTTRLVTTEGPTTRVVTTEGPTTRPVTTEGPTTRQVTTEGPTTPVVTTEGPTTPVVTTEGPTTPVVTTEGPTTRLVTTEGPTTRLVTTEGPTTRPVTTEGPTTRQVTTEGPTTRLVTTEGPTTPVVTTEGPTTRLVTTEGPTTPVVTTEGPTTRPVTTEGPTTRLVTTEGPTTRLVTTEGPTTPVVTTEGPTTPVVTTEGPTTRQVTTEGPTTHLVTTEGKTARVVTTEGPTTPVVTTEGPTTRQVTTEGPTTHLITTEGPTTRPVTTEGPTTRLVTTEGPTTPVVTTQGPTTPVVTTAGPTTRQVTTEGPTTHLVTTEGKTTPVVTTEGPTTRVDTTKEATTSGTTKEQTTPTPATTEASTTEIVTVTLEKVDKVTTEGPTTKLVTTEGPTTPLVTTEGPTTRQITTEGPTTRVVTTEGPTTPVVTTEGPTTPVATTEGPTTRQVTTEGPTTRQITTEGPTTPVVTTEGPTTPVATTEGPTTRQVTTEGPTTRQITTEGPTTPVITTEGPTTPVVTTEGPTTPVATTEGPTTRQVTTEGPTTRQITTEGPTTPVITTEGPTTPVVTTEGPTTPLVTTEGPTTRQVTTEGPTTRHVTTEGPTTPVITTEGPTTPVVTTEGPTTPVATTEGPTTRQVTTEGPTTRQVTTEGPTTRQITTEGPTTPVITTEGPTTPVVTTEGPTTPVATTEGPTTRQVTTEGPTTRKKVTTEGPTTKLVTTEGQTTRLVTTEGPTTRLATTEGPTTRPVTTEGPTTPVVTTEGPTTRLLSTEGPTTHLVTTEGQTTRLVTTEGPTTRLVTTEGPTTPVVTTEGPTTRLLSTEGPTTHLVTTEGPTTRLATTEGPTTRLVTTEGPTTHLVTTESPTTPIETTEGPTTRLATTEGPTTHLVTTEGPTTRLVTTEGPTTHLVTTEGPTTRLVTTEGQTTHLVTTEGPTTRLVTTEGPTTPIVTTEGPTTLLLSTEGPTTHLVTTEGPTTRPATTEGPTTRHVTTEGPTTRLVTTEGPTTLLVTTEGPTTRHVTTEGPTTRLVTTEGPTTHLAHTEEPTTPRITTQEPPTTYSVTTAVETTPIPSTTTEAGTTEIVTASLEPEITTIRVTQTLPPQLCTPGYTDWMNIDTPMKTSGNDIESIEELRKFFSFCSYPLKIECIDIYTHESSHDLEENVICTLTDGLICYDSDQDDGKCRDYAVRFDCGNCYGSTLAPQTTGPCGDGKSLAEFTCEKMCNSMQAVQPECQTDDDATLTACVTEQPFCTDPNKRIMDVGGELKCVAEEACRCWREDSQEMVAPGSSWTSIDDECEVCQCFNNAVECARKTSGGCITTTPIAPTTVVIKTTQAATTFVSTEAPVLEVCPHVTNTTHCPRECEAGKFCNGHSCVDMVDCPCYYEGGLFNGMFINDRCETCNCFNGNVTCVAQCNINQCAPGEVLEHLEGQCCECVPCECQQGEFHCQDSKDYDCSEQCIPEEYVCDSIVDCPNSEDEGPQCPTSLPDEDIECYTDSKARDYRGQVGKTATGKRCQKWMDQTPHGHPYTPDMYLDAGLEENYCRNPNDRQNAWCYTTDPDTTWEICDIGPPVEQCGCIDSSTGETRKVGEYWTEYNCKDCYCEENGKSTCNATDCKNDCSVYLESFKTFDGKTFQYTYCDHSLVSNSTSDLPYFDIRLELICRDGEEGFTSQVCKPRLEVTIRDTNVKLWKNGLLHIDDHYYSASQLETASQQLEQRQGFSITKSGGSYVIRTDFNLVVEWRNYAEVIIKLDDKLYDKVHGMCGVPNNNVVDEFTMKDGSVADDVVTFADDYGSQEDCPEEEEVCLTEYPSLKDQAERNCSVLASGALGDCEVDVNQCEKTMCECLNRITSNGPINPQDCLCEVLAKCNIPECRPECPAPFVWDDCPSPCEQTCTTAGQPWETCPIVGECSPGCVCPDGLVREGDRCIKKEDCTQCFCYGFGCQQYYTFDASNVNFEGDCSYELARDTSGQHNFEIILENEYCRNTDNYVSIIVRNQGTEIQLRPNQKVVIDGTEYEKLSHAFEGGMNLLLSGGTHYILRIAESHIEVQYNDQIKYFSIMMPMSLHYGTTKGLCGPCNGRRRDDKTKPDGRIADNDGDFAASWIHGDDTNCTTVLPTPEPPTCDEELVQELFKDCRLLVDIEPYLRICTNNSICELAAVYASQCSKSCMCFDWREQLGCPPPECRGNSEYQACHSPCVETCFDGDEQNGEECHKCPIEGCYCPENYVWDTDFECVPTCEKCYDRDGVKRFLNDTWKPNECETCTCLSGGEVFCSSVTCPDPPPESDCLNPKHWQSTPGVCCPTYECVCDPDGCPSESYEPTPDCASDRELVDVTLNECCTAAECVCKSCPDVSMPSCESYESLESYKDSDEDCCYKYRCVCNATKCVPPVMNCPEFHEVQKTPPNGDGCCPEYDCVCKCPPIVMIDCPLGHTQEIIQISEECECDGIKCVQLEVCIWNDTSKNQLVEVDPGTTDLVGRDPCRSCDCLEEIDTTTNFYRLECVREQCKHGGPEDCSIVEEYVPPADGQCCGYCNVTKCIDEDGAVYDMGYVGKPVHARNPCDRVICRRDDDGVSRLYPEYTLCPEVDMEKCQAPLYILKNDSKGCCQYCEAVSRQCRPHVEEKEVTVNGCHSNGFKVDVASCEGRCDSRATYSFEAKDIKTNCACCSVLKSSKRSVELTCDDGEVKIHEYDYIEACDCKPCQQSQESEETTFQATEGPTQGLIL